MLKKSFALVVSLACALIAASGADKNQIKVEASRALRMAVVDSDRKGAGREAVHTTFGEALAFELSQRCKSPVPVKIQVADADHAAWGLANGSFDIGLVVGKNVPRGMVSADFTILKAAQPSGKGKFALFLVMRRDDPGLSEMLSASFPESLKGQFFLRAVAKANGLEVPEDWALVVASN